jgi:hypothetical protein
MAGLYILTFTTTNRRDEDSVSDEIFTINLSAGNKTEIF